MGAVDAAGIHGHSFPVRLTVESHIESSGTTDGEYVPGTEQLEAAIHYALARTRLFEAVTTDASHELAVLLRTVRATMTTRELVEVVMDWSLIDVSTGETVVKERVHTRGEDRSFAKAARRRNAAEAAFRDNIAEAFARIAAPSPASDR